MRSSRIKLRLNVYLRLLKLLESRYERFISRPFKENLQTLEYVAIQTW